MSEPGDTFKGFAVIVEAIGFHSFDKKLPSIVEAMSSSWNAQKENKVIIKSKRQFIEHVILKNEYKGLSSPDATEEEKAADRQSFLNKKTTRWRRVFSRWPRDPKGKHIRPENSGTGKMAPNEAQLWGATIFNFYATRRFPDIPGLATYSSGSKLANWMKTHGEDYAKDQLEFAEHEEDPYVIDPYKIDGLIQDGDVMGMTKKSWIRDEQDEGESVGDKRKRKEKERARQDWEVPQPVRLSTILFCAYVDPNH